ncbi:hypothetical protein KP004_01305 [Geomonas oryzisoli]|uniref:DUF5666 domain-containing protein n=1 Tax=Geomonas oryzisoli TaxID=2847992 RepID=A0ABX8J6B9_9BACT|nr:hypothetical protein [Geomonas oryzisoli]QWV93860.1 hypothetical protein KP004_01305 [Geomonas oryzisoli]
MKKILVAALATLACLAGNVTGASADVTGDFKVVSATYTNHGDSTGGDVTISGSVNNGAIQSGKSVVVDYSFDYSFLYQIVTETGTVSCAKTKKDGTIQIIGEGACTNKEFAEDKAFNIDTTVKTTQKLSASGMKAVKAPTVTKDGRLNPNGRITGYDWSALYSIVPLDEIVDPALIPDGATLVPGSVSITSVKYSAYLIEPTGAQIPDTLVSGILFQTP